MSLTQYEKEVILLARLSKAERIALTWFVFSDENPREKAIDAYRFSRPGKNITKNDNSAYSSARLWISSEPCKVFISRLKDRFFSPDTNPPGVEFAKIDDEDSDQEAVRDADPESRDNIVRILWRHLKAADKGGDSRTVSDLAARLEAIKYKKAEKAPENDSVRRYMPLRCFECALFKANAEK